MAKQIIPREFKDWSELDIGDSFFKGIDTSREENFGIHLYNGKLWTSGYVGVGRLYDSYGRALHTKGAEHVIVVNSQYNMDPWLMLEKVMTDDEYDTYIEELAKDNKYLFRIFYDQPVVKLNQDSKMNGDMLYALSFINQCYFLCRKGIKKQMVKHEENLTAKIKGRINIQKNIRKNTCNGRNDRFYCKYIDFTCDTIENRILKATLIRCKCILKKRFTMENEIISRLNYCMNSFRGVTSVTIRNRDFNNVSATGLYIYYKPLLKQAKCILGQKYMSYVAEDGLSINKSVYTIPYMINMETVFELYVRTVFRENIDTKNYYLEKYSKKIFLEKGVSDISNTRKGIHLMSYCIPDVIISDKVTHKPILVLDAKYKKDDKPARSDSQQLLSYVLLTGVNKCGFVMPGEITEVKRMGVSDYMELSSPLFRMLKYYEFLLGNETDKSEIRKLL
ncbi:MAG: hypothetical protein E7262_10655 [Lachnospiraceae bacterium]|nr:hypothetical protein [Lachnospiraceae bacterium]